MVDSCGFISKKVAGTKDETTQIESTEKPQGE
jgi:hypothetical protein